MRNTALGRCLVDLGKATRNNLVKACFCLTLTLIALPFAISVEQKTADGGTGDDARANQPNQESYWVRLTDPVAMFTLLLTVSTTGLWFVTWRGLNAQSRDTRRSLKISETAVNVAYESARAAIRQAAAAEDTLVKRERPYLFVYGARYIKKNEEFDSYFVEFHVANHGAMPAIIDEAFFDVVTAIDSPANPGKIGDWHYFVRNSIIGAGEKIERVTINIRRYIISGESGGVIIVGDDTKGYPIPTFNIDDNENVYLRVIINYSGPFSTGHTTDATWIYDHGSAEFTQWGGEEYNRRT